MGGGRAHARHHAAGRPREAGGKRARALLYRASRPHGGGGVPGPAAPPHVGVTFKGRTRRARVGALSAAPRPAQRGPGGEGGS